LTDWGLTTFSAQTAYIVLLKSMLQLKSEIIVDVTCWE